MSRQEKLQRAINSLQRLPNAAVFHPLLVVTEGLRTSHGAALPNETLVALLNFLKSFEGLEQLELCEVRDALVGELSWIHIRLGDGPCVPTRKHEHALTN